ncbi:MAG TPA: 23S rRNA (uracil(1939)-C(5))-methyltransferase RlmD [Legionellaceae bacterium]|nr:23S rRNA (uracil(1939)-C(5))-methyltransferase RlmD [Legionellaceae bacterium]
MMNSTKASITHTTDIDKFAHDGRGIARIAGKTTFIEGALPQETVVFEYTRRKSDYDEGRVLEVLAPSPHRVTPPCPHYELCGGCSLQHLAVDAQIQIKQTLLLDILQRIGHCQPLEILPSLVDTHHHYRNKARLSVRYVEKKSSTLIGFREKKNPRYITDIQQCPVMHAKVDAHINEMRALLDKIHAPRCIAQIEVAAGEDAVALILRHLTPLNDADKQLLEDFAKRTGFRIFLQPAGPDSVHLFYPLQSDEYLHYSLPEFDLTYRFHPTDFTQINAGINRQMVSKAIQLLNLHSTDVVLDLFCGLGNFTLPIARHCAEVIGIEGSQTMIERAAMNAKINQIFNVEFACGNLEEWTFPKTMLHKVNKVLLDPPRSGALNIVKQMQQLQPALIVYVSCNPVTLARDAEHLITQGYVLHSAGVMDMFPHTSHVESMALFLKNK